MYTRKRPTIVMSWSTAKPTGEDELADHQKYALFARTLRAAM